MPWKLPFKGLVNPRLTEERPKELSALNRLRELSLVETKVTGVKGLRGASRPRCSPCQKTRDLVDFERQNRRKRTREAPDVR
jgi:hypothetical protein